MESNAGLKASTWRFSLGKYGNKNLLLNPALNESVVLSTYQETTPLNAYSETVPVYSQPTPIIGDFSRSGKAELIINDRDEIGLISIPLLIRNASVSQLTCYRALRGTLRHKSCVAAQHNTGELPP